MSVKLTRKEFAHVCLAKPNTHEYDDVRARSLSYSS